MNVAVGASMELTESRIKELIKTYGGPDSLPKRKKAVSADNKLEKTDYINSLIEVMRKNPIFENDYQQIALFIQKELKTKAASKGFGKK